MQIPQEVITSRHLDTYSDTDPELLFAVGEYNEKMVNRQKFKRRLKLLENVFLAVNVAIMIVFGGMMPSGAVFLFGESRVVWLENVCLIAFIAAFVIFGLWKRIPIAVTAASVLLIFTDARCFFQVGVNVVFTVFIMKNRAAMKSMDGYPNFFRIHLEKHNGKKPENSEKEVDKSEEL